MSKKKSFALRLDPVIYKALEQWAADEFRSTNGQLEWIIHKALVETGRLKTIKHPDKIGGEEPDSAD